MHMFYACMHASINVATSPTTYTIGNLTSGSSLNHIT
jgi:hypothetical protein